MSAKAVMFVVVLLLFVSRQAECNDVEQQSIVDRLFEGYRKEVRPNADALLQELTLPVSIAVSLSVYHLKETASDGTFEVSMVFRQWWTDERLDYRSKLYNNKTEFEIPAYVTIDDGRERLWLPDTFFHSGLFNSRVEMETFRVYRDGTILWSQKIDSDLTCPMDVYQFPFDEHKCTIVVTSYAMEETDCSYTWRKELNLTFENTINEQLQHFHIIRKQAQDYCTLKELNGQYSCIRGHLFIDRIALGYVMMCIVPNHLIVFLSWIMFYLPSKNYSAKFSIGFVSLTFIAIIWASVHAGERLPTDATALHVHAIGCIVFIALSMLIQAATMFVVPKSSRVQIATLKRGAKRGLLSSERNCDDGGSHYAESEVSTSQRRSSIVSPHGMLAWRLALPKHVDFVCRIVMPVLFTMFTFVYALIYHGL